MDTPLDPAAVPDVDTNIEPSFADLFLRDGEIMTVPILADRLDVHPNTVLEWLRTGRIRGFQVGREWRMITVNVIADLRNFSNADAVTAHRDSDNPDDTPSGVQR